MDDLHFDLNIYEVKRCLISRDLKKKIYAVTKILEFINSRNSEEYFIEKLINADLNALLCEASCTTNTILLQLTFECFSKFVKCHAFFEQQHTVYTFESLLRSLHVLVRIDHERVAFFCGLQLVCEIISRVKSNEIPLNNVCDISNLLNLTCTIFKDETNIKVIYAAAQVVLSILYSGDVVQVEEAAREVVSTSLHTLGALHVKESTKHVIALIAELVNASNRFLVPKTNGLKTDAEKDEKIQEFHRKLHTILKEILVPYIIENKSLYDDQELMQIILSSLLSVYYLPGEKITQEFSTFLFCAGLLDCLQEIESLASDQEVITVLRSFLLELLICLSYQGLGNEKWRSLISPGLEAMPVRRSYNSIFLYDSDTGLSIASIVYNYFFLLSSPSPNVDVNFLRDLSRYITLLFERPTEPLMKALWFTYCVAYLCHPEDHKHSRFTLMKFINFLMDTDICSVYTHHPAILYWAFSDNGIPNELQAKVVLFWLEKGDLDSVSIIKSLLAINRDSLFLTMDLLAAVGSEKSEHINNILSSVLPECRDLAELYHHVWSTLPTHLAKYSSNPQIPTYEGLAYFMKFCCAYEPVTLDKNVVMRISCLLPAAFTNYFRITFSDHSQENLVLRENEAHVVINNFILVTTLLHIGMRRNDNRVSASFLGHVALLSSIEFFTAANDENVINTTMQLLKCLIYCQIKTRQKSSKVIQMDGMKILKFLQGKSELCTTVLSFLALYFEARTENIESCIIEVPQPSEIQLRSLYLHIHMICAKSDDETASCCWVCLRKLLEFSECSGLKGHLAALPYTPSLLLRTTEPEAWREAVAFLSVWLKVVPRGSSKALSPTLSLEAIRQLTRRLSKSTNGKQLIDKMKLVFLAENDKGAQKLAISPDK